MHSLKIGLFPKPTSFYLMLPPQISPIYSRGPQPPVRNQAAQQEVSSFISIYIFILIWWVPTICHVLFLTVEIKDDEQDKVTAQWNTPPNRRDRG